MSVPSLFITPMVNAMPDKDEDEAASLEEIAYSSRTYEERLARIEEYTERRVGSTMAAIESAVSAWEAAGGKPPHLAGRINTLRQFYEALRQWEAKSLRSRERGAEARKERLMEFSKICTMFGRRLGAEAK